VTPIWCLYSNPILQKISNWLFLVPQDFMFDIFSFKIGFQVLTTKFKKQETISETKMTSEKLFTGKANKKGSDFQISEFFY
jgi:hypothetical protein